MKICRKGGKLMQLYDEQVFQQQSKQEIKQSTAWNYAKVYLCFALGILVTGAMALFYPLLLSKIGASFQTYYISLMIFAVLTIVFSLVAGFQRIKGSAVGIGIGYFAYAICIGGMVSSFVVFTEDLTTLFYAFLVSGASFLIMGIVGVATKGRLSRYLSVLLIAVMGLSVISLFNILLFGNSMLYWIVSILILAVNLIVASVDMNRVHEKTKMGQFTSSNVESLYEAYLLYADFMIIFIYIMRFLLIARSNNN